MGQVEGRFQKVEAARMGVQAAHASMGGSNAQESILGFPARVLSDTADHAYNYPAQGVLRTSRKTTSGNVRK